MLRCYIACHVNPNYTNLYLTVIFTNYKHLSVINQFTFAHNRKQYFQYLIYVTIKQRGLFNNISNNLIVKLIIAVVHCILIEITVDMDQHLYFVFSHNLQVSSSFWIRNRGCAKNTVWGWFYCGISFFLENEITYWHLFRVCNGPTYHNLHVVPRFKKKYETYIFGRTDSPFTITGDSSVKQSSHDIYFVLSRVKTK